jgi:hypothetical protein
MDDDSLLSYCELTSSRIDIDDTMLTTSKSSFLNNGSVSFGHTPMAEPVSQPKPIELGKSSDLDRPLRNLTIANAQNIYASLPKPKPKQSGTNSDQSYHKSDRLATVSKAKSTHVAKLQEHVVKCRNTLKFLENQNSHSNIESRRKEVENLKKGNRRKIALHKGSGYFGTS